MWTPRACGQRQFGGAARRWLALGCPVRQTARQAAGLLVLSGALALQACGGGGGGNGVTSPPPAAQCSAGVCYVRTAGNDADSGDDPGHALRTIAMAAQIARDGYRIIVGPGTYREEVNTARSGPAPSGLTFTADVTGAQTGDLRGPVVIDVTGVSGAAGFNLSNAPGSVIDGFTITGASDSGIIIKSQSDDFMVRNCIVHDNPGNGIVVQDSDSVLLFNNLVYGNGKFGINITGVSSGSPNSRVINNTVYGNTIRGVTVGSTQVASPAPFVRNNILQNNEGDSNFKIFTVPPDTTPRSDVNYQGDHNLVFPAGTYVPPAIQRPHDVNMDALFVSVADGDFHLVSGSPAINAGDSLNNFPDLKALLRAGTTSGAGNLDSGALDIGYHYPS